MDAPAQKEIAHLHEGPEESIVGLDENFFCTRCHAENKAGDMRPSVIRKEYQGRVIYEHTRTCRVCQKVEVYPRHMVLWNTVQVTHNPPK